MHLLSHTHFTACHTCGVLHPLVQCCHGEAGSPEADALESYGEFIAKHRDHRRAEFHRDGSESSADRPLWDPLAAITFAVSDGERSYVVVSGRTSVDEPRTYRFMCGSVIAPAPDISADADALRRGLDFDFYPNALRPTKIDRLLAALDEVVSRIDADELPIAYDTAEDPDVSIAAMPEEPYIELVARCVDIFDEWELARVVRFLHTNRGADGLLALRVRRHQSIALSA